MENEYVSLNNQVNFKWLYHIVLKCIIVIFLKTNIVLSIESWRQKHLFIYFGRKSYPETN